MIAVLGRDGALARAVLAARPGLLCELSEEAEADETPVRFRLERLGGLLADLRRRGVTDLCLAGAVRRPRLDPTALDDLTRPLAPRLAALMAQGDDGTLRGLIALLEEQGFAVHAAHEIAPDLLPPPGLLAGTLTPEIEAAAARAAAIHAALGPADVGQALVLRDGQALAVEASPGTDWMLRSIAGTGQGGLLYKAPKPGQDRRADLPAIGPDTIRLARAAGLDAVVIEAGGVMVFDRDAVRDAAGPMTVWVRP